MPYDDREYQKRKRQARIAAGLCSRCGKKPAAEGVLYCDECREYHRKRADWEYSDPTFREKRSLAQKRWREANHEYSNERQRKYVRALRDNVLTHYGPKCVCCGETRKEFLTVDHIDGGGNEHRRQIGGNLYRWLRRNGYPEGFQILCWNCNHAKGIYGTCPHQST